MNQNAAERGSGFVMAIFVIVLLTGVGVILLGTTQTEVRTARADNLGKGAFYFAEAGLEDGRETLRAVNSAPGVGVNGRTFTDELTTAAGPDGALNVAPDNMRAVFDSHDKPIGFAGAGDDRPIRSFTSFGRGAYASYLSNDPAEGRANRVDNNSKALITALGAGPDGSFSISEAVVEPFHLPDFPASITILGPNPDFHGGTSNAKYYTGNDCAGGIPGYWVPTVGVIEGPAPLDPNAVADAQAGVSKPSNYTAGPYGGIDTVQSVTNTIDPLWLDCRYFIELAEVVKAGAEVVGNASTPNSSLGTPTNPKIVFIDGDYTFTGSGGGLLWITGTLRMIGNVSWDGVILTVGKGDFDRAGAGTGDFMGAIMVARMVGQDGIFGTSDDCDGADGVEGTSDDGWDQGSASFATVGAGNSTLGYCTPNILNAEWRMPLHILSFRQR